MRRVLGLVGLALLAGCASSGGRTPSAPAPARPGAVERGLASWYGEPYHGRRTACGEVYDMHRMTAAHRTLPFDTVVEVTRRDDGRRVEVRINDRGPFIRGRIIDLSYAAACRIGLDRDGITPVEVRVLGTAPASAPPARQPAAATEEPGCWWVQVGAFADPGNAERARERLAAAGRPAVAVEGPGGLLRVRLGPFSARAEAEAAHRAVLAEWPAAETVACGS